MDKKENYGLRSHTMYTGVQGYMAFEDAISKMTLKSDISTSMEKMAPFIKGIHYPNSNGCHILYTTFECDSLLTLKGLVEEVEDWIDEYRI